MLVSKICLTGGPCGGKTKALSKLEQELSDMGYKVFIINEIATRIINSGIKPFGEDAIKMIDFEDILLNLQLEEERAYEKACNLIDKKCVILCDRGVFDVKSFISGEEFDMLLNKYNLSKLELIDSYNEVIHMNTCAKGAEEFYTTENNKARSEGIKEAVIRDDRCQEAWSFHPNFKIVDNSTNFDDKVNKVINIMKESLGIKTKEEKKYLIELKKDAYDKLKEKECVTIYITQVYLKTENDYEMRLRKRVLDGDETYYVSVKKSYGNKEKIVTEEKIDKKSYERLISQREVTNIVEKKRTCFTQNNHVYKIDEYDNGLFVLETDINASIPEFISVIEDVTLNQNFKNKNISMSNIRKSLYKRKKCCNKM